MKRYYRLMLGRKSAYADQCFAGNFVGADFDIAEDLTNNLPDEWRAFNSAYIPVYMKGHPDKTKIAAGLSCGFLWTVAKGMKQGDIVLCPDGKGAYCVGEITGDYRYAPDEILPHRRPVHWFDQGIDRSAMTDELRNSTGSIGTVCEITRYQLEIEKLIGITTLISKDPTVEDPAAFALEKHLEDFLVLNWTQTDLAKEFDIYEEEGERVGQQYPTDTGPIDILAVSKDKQRLLVVELKKGRASDNVVGQVLRYMGYVKEVLAENGQTVQGAIIALEDDQKIRRALSVVPSITFYRYQISFNLVRA